MENSKNADFVQPVPLGKFQKMYDHYEESVKKGGRTKDKNDQDRIKQTKWVWFPKETLDRVFESMNGTTDPRYVKGVKIYLTAYRKNDRIDPDNYDYTGLMTNVLVASLFDSQEKTINDVESEAFLAPENAGTMSPPNRETGDMVK